MKAVIPKSPASSNKNTPSFTKETEQNFFKQKTEEGFFSGNDYRIQTKLTVGQPNDKYEREADHVAEQVVQRMSAPDTVSGKQTGLQAKPLAQQVTPVVQAKCAECEKEEEEEKAEGEKGKLRRKPLVADGVNEAGVIQRKCAHCEEEEKKDKGEEKGLQRKADSEAASKSSLSVENGLNKDSGAPLPSSVSSSMGNAFGADFSGVRIHTGSNAVQMSNELNAQAFTHGKDIYFNAGKYAPDSSAGKKLLAHELTHTVQQGSAGESIQREPQGTGNCAPNSTTKLSIDEVTKKCPSPKGEIAENGATKTITIFKLKIKSNSPKSLIDKLPKPLTLPKPGSRKDKANATKQVSIWNQAVRDDVIKSLNSLLTSINTDQSLESKKDPKNKYSIKLKTGKGEATLTGTFTELQNGVLISKWNTAGTPLAFQVEHILDYQVAGKEADTIENLMLLSAQVNNNLGQVMKEFIRSDIETILAHYNKFVENGKLVTKVDEARTNYEIKAKEFEKINPSIKPEEQIVKDALKNPAEDPLRNSIVDFKVQKLEKGQFILKSSNKGGGVILSYSKKNFDIGSYRLTTDGNAEAGTISSIKATQIVNGNHTEDKPEEKTYTLKPVPGEAHTYKADNFGAQMANLKLKYLSLIEFEPPDIDESLNITAYGKINAPSPKFLNNTPIEVILIGRDLTIQKIFSASQLGSVGPIKVDDAALILSLSTQSGFGAGGFVRFSIPKAGKGQVEAKASKEGYVLSGQFDFDTKTFDQATVKVSYDSVKDKAGKNPWTINGKLVIGKDKVSGINSATIDVAYQNDILTLKGNANLNVPGIKSAAIDASYTGGDLKLAIKTEFDFKNKFIKDPKLEVTLATGGDDKSGKAFSLGISGSMNIEVPNFKTINVLVTYKEGTFDANAQVNDLKVGKYVTGNIQIGATNANVDDAGKVSGAGAGKQLLFYGTGSITVTLGENIKTVVDVKYSKQGKILISGKLVVDKQPLLKNDLLAFQRELFKISTPNIPVFSIGVGDIFLRIEGAAHAMAKIESPKVSITVELKDTDIFDPQGFKIGASIKPEISAEAGVDLSVKFILGARVLILEISGNVGGTLKLHVKANADATLQMDWSSGKGIVFKSAKGSLMAAINVSGAITGGVAVDLNLFLTRIKVWSKDWELGKMNFGNLGTMSFNFPIDFDENGSIKTPDTKQLKPESPYAEKDGASNFLSKQAGGGENKVEKKPEDFKKEIFAFFHTLPAIGPANPQYQAVRSRHYFVAEVEKGYPEISWKWLRDEWAAVEMEEFRKLVNEVRQPRSNVIDDQRRLDDFALNHPTVSSQEIDVLRSELNLKAGKGLQAKAENPAEPEDDFPVSEPLEKALNGTAGGGRPLPQNVRQDMEASMGSDFADVRIHDDENARMMNRDLNARAFTHGNDIYFNAGNYNPNTRAGKQLLAHELTHVSQQRGANGPRELQRDDKQSPPAPKPATGISRMKISLPQGDFIELSDNYDEVRINLEMKVAAKGRGYLAVILERFKDGLNIFEFGKTGKPSYNAPWSYAPPIYPSDRKKLSPDDEYRLHKGKEIYQLTQIVVAQLNFQYDMFMADFRYRLEKNALEILKISEERSKSEFIRYGLMEGHTESEGIFWGDNYLPSFKGLQQAAGILAKRKIPYEKKQREIKQFIVGLIGSTLSIFYHEENTNKLNKLKAEAEALKKPYDQVLAYLSLEYPVLAYLANSDGEMLEKMANSGDDTMLIATVIGQRVKEQTENIGKCREGIKDKEVNFWRLPNVVEFTMYAGGANNDPVYKKLIADKVESEKPGMLQTVALIIMDVVAVLLAGPTFGISLGVAAAVNVAVAVEEVQAYLMQKAQANTDFDKAHSLSQEDPSFFWLAISLAGVIPEVGNLAKAFRGMSRAIRNVKHLRSVEAVEEMEDVIRAIGKENNLSDDVIEGIIKSAKNQDELLKVVGLSADEISGLKAAKAGEKLDAVPGVVNQTTKAEIKISGTGYIYSCSSPCTVLREKYAKQLANNSSLTDELNILEQEARNATTADAKKIIADKAGDLEGKLRMVPTTSWRSPIADAPGFDDLAKKRGSVGPELDVKPEGWTGSMEARFRYGDDIKAEKGYRWVLEQDGTLRYDRLDDTLPKRVFDPDTKTFRDVPPKASAVDIEPQYELERMAQLGKTATSKKEWYKRLRRGIPSMKYMSDEAIARVMKLSPNIDHMKGQLLEEVAGLIAKKSIAKRGIEFIPGHLVRDASGKQLTDGILVRRRKGGVLEVVGVIESKAGRASSEGLRRSHKSFASLSEKELDSLRMDAIEELRIRKGLTSETIDELPPGPLPKGSRSSDFSKEEVEAVMKDIHASDMGQIEKDFERLMPGADEKYVKIQVGDKTVKADVSPSKTKIYSSTPSDVVVDASALAGRNISVKALDIGLTSDELIQISRLLRAENLVNGAKMTK